MISDLRTAYPLLSYLTVMDMRFICQEAQIYQYYSTNTDNVALAQAHAQKLTAKFAFIRRKIQNKDTIDIISHWKTLDHNIYISELNKWLNKTLIRQQDTEKKRPLISTDDLIDLQARANTYLELYAFAQYEKDFKQHQTTLDNLAVKICKTFNILNDTFTVDDTKQLLKTIEPFDERKIFGTLGGYLTDAFAVAVQPLSRQDTLKFAHDTQHRNIKTMLPGKPHLYFVDEVDLVLSRVIKLFSELNQEPQACQILFCSNQTTLEEVICFLFRCCYHAQDFKRNLYCLVQPGNLQNHITDEILSLLLKKLRKAQAYFCIITCDRNNRWYTDLSIYLSELEVLTDDQSKKFYERYIIKFGDAPSKHNINNPVCVVFMSDEECVGKTYQINRTCTRFKLECIHIPFNSPKLDKDFVVDKLCSGEHQLLDKKLQNKLKNKKIVFHLNISSHAGKDVNVLLFQLLILRHITKSNGESFIVRPHHVFFIELPSQISTTFSKTGINDVKRHFYFLAGTRSHIHKDIIKMELSKYYCSREHQFVLRYLDALDQTIQGKQPLLKIVGPQKGAEDWNFTSHPQIGTERMIELVTKFANKKDLNFVFLKSYLDFLYRQLVQLIASAILINNDLAVDINTGFWKSARYIQYHHVIAASFARMGSSFACENYEVENPFSQRQHQHWLQKQRSLKQKEQRKSRRISKFVDYVVYEEKMDYKEMDDDNDEEEKYDIEQSFLEETKGDETFSLIHKWATADPPIVFLNPAYISQIKKPNLDNDLKFQQKNAENALTLLCKSLAECEHPDAEEWKALKQTLDVTMGLKFEELDFDAEDKQRRENISESKILAENKKTQKEKLRLLLRLCGGYRKYDKTENRIKAIIDENERHILVEKLYAENSGYALTFDNILKIAAIFFRVQSGIPVLIMGETGCGKTRLLRYMADILSMKMLTIDVHGGYVLSDLQRDIATAVKVATGKYENRTVLLFLDEINTSEEIASFKEIICDHHFRGNKLPNNLVIIGALNPYRTRKLSLVKSAIKKEDEKNNKTFYNNSMEKKMSQLVYTVYPLPPSMKRFVWNFGYIAPIDEKQYIAVITAHEWETILNEEKHQTMMRKYFIKYQPMFAKLIDESQTLLREWLCDISVCSLRDVRRANKFFGWFYKQSPRNDSSMSQTPINRIIRSMIMALAQCFYYRLTFEHRKHYGIKISNQLNKLEDVFSENDSTIPGQYFAAHNFKKILAREQERYLDILKIPDGIALNRAFKENIFVMLVGIVTQTPTIVVGRPGSSKTLAMNILEENLNPVSKNEELTALNIENYVVQQFQCSKLTTPHSIQQQWDHAEQVQRYEDAAKRVLFLDEMGLAEQSNKKPLKVLHKLLEEPKIAFIGLSNWSLDSAKMNRVVLHEVMPIHQDKKDLEKTALALAKNGPGGKSVVALINKLPKLVNFYRNLIEKQKTRDSPFGGEFNFFGARDFYNTIAYLKFCCNALDRRMDTKLVMEAICRNFGGLTETMFDKYMFEMILETLDLKAGGDNDLIASRHILWDEMTAINLIRYNIIQSHAKDSNPQTQNYDMRHVMLITDTEVSWKYLYDMNILEHNTSRVIFGSKFKNDNSSLHLHQNIDKIKNAMVMGHTVVLLHLDELYDSLYDVLNQRYLTIASKRFSNISIRNETIRVQIDPSFRFIIVVPTTSAHHTSEDINSHTPVAFLNRLEKQYLSLKNLCGTRKNWDQLLQRLEMEIEDIFGLVNFSQIFAGYVPRLTFASVLIYVENKFYGLNHNQRPTDDDEDSEDQQYDNEIDADAEIINYSMALLLSNCYVRHFINHIDLSLHRKLKPIKRDKCFSSIRDIMTYYRLPEIENDEDEITLIRVTTHDHFQHVSDFRKYFRIKRRIDQFEIINKDMMTIAKLRAPDSIQFGVSRIDEEGESDSERMDIPELNDNDSMLEEKESPYVRENAILMNIGDIVSSAEFVGAINEFLVDKEYHTLIIQTTNKNNDEFLHNLHIQYLIEQSKYTCAKERATNKQIMVIVYMNRLTSDIKSKNDAQTAQYIQSQQYPLIFNCEWKQVYCDAILPSEIKITDLNINDTYSSRIFETRIARHTESVIESTFEMALNNIRFPAKMRTEVDRITKIFYHPDDKHLKRAIICRIKEVLSSSRDGSPLDAIKTLLKLLNVKNKNRNKRLSVGSDGNRLSDDIISERGSFRQLLIKQISKQMKSELVEVLIAVLNHHSSDLYQPPIVLKMSSSYSNHQSMLSSPSMVLTDANIEREQRKNDVWMRNIWLILLQHKSGIVRVQTKFSRQSNSNNCSNVEVKLKVEFPFSPYIDAYFHHVQRAIVNTVTKDDFFKQRPDMQVNESGHKGQEIMVPIIANHLKSAGLDDALLAINKYIECYVYDVAVLELQKQFDSRYKEIYFDALTRFIQQFILCAAHQTHHKFEKTSMITDIPLIAQEDSDDDNKFDEELDEDIDVLHESDDDDDDDEDNGGMTIDNDTYDSEHHSNSNSDSANTEKDSDDAIESVDEDVAEEVESDDDHKDDLKDEYQEIEDEIPYPYGIHEVHAALWCNERLLQKLIHIMTVLEHKPQRLDNIVTVCWSNFKTDGLLKCIHRIINEIIDMINNQFQNADTFTFKILMNMIIDCSESVSWVLHWLQKQHFNIQKLLSLNTKWHLIRLYLLCYKPFEKCQSESQLRLIKAQLQYLYHEFCIKQHKDEFAMEENNVIMFGDVDKMCFVVHLMETICRSLCGMNKDKHREDKLFIDSREITQYVIQQYICNFALNTFEIMPKEDFLFYLISLMSDKDNVEEKQREDDDEFVKFIADPYTKQEIASKILKLISIYDDNEILRILNKLNDALSVNPLLSSVLLRASECEEHSKWLKRSKKKQTPTEQNIAAAAKQLKNSQKQAYLYQLLAIAKCKVILHYAVANMKKLQDSYLRALSKMFTVKSKCISQYQSLIHGLGFFFFSEIWRQKGSLDACKLRKNRKFTEKIFLKHIFEPDDMEGDSGDIIILKSKYKHLDDNIFNLLIDTEENKLQTLRASDQTILKIRSSLNITHALKSKIMNISAKKSENKSDHSDIDRFTLLSSQMYRAITKGEEMTDELQLESREIVHLIGAVFNCAYLYGGNNEERIYLWLRDQLVIPKRSRMHFLIGQLLNNSSPDSTLKYDPNRAPPLEQMLRVRLSWHLFGVASSVNKSNPFYILLNNPLYYADAFLIGMPESQQMALLRAMCGHSVFVCPNKHLYFVANCGATKESGKCYQCNADVGNEKNKAQHHAAAGNRKLGIIGNNGEIIPDDYGASNGIAQIPSEYMATGYIDSISHDDCTRNLSAIAVCIIRCFVLCMLWLHHSERSDEFPSQCQQFMYPHRWRSISKRQNDAQLSTDIHDKIKKYIKKIQKKLGRSIEDTFYVLHAIIHKFYLNYDLMNLRAKKDVNSRLQFEAFLMSHCIEPVMQNLDRVIHNVRNVVSSDSFKKYWSKRIDMGFIKNKKAFCDKYSPHLFLPFRHITLSNFRSYVLANADAELYPITCGIIEALDNIGLSIFATQYIPSIVCWMKLVHQRLSGRISKKEMNEIDADTQLYKYNAQVLLQKCKEEGFGDDKKWNTALIGFVNGWNDVARRVTTKESELGAKIINKNNHQKSRAFLDDDDDKDDDDKDDDDDDDDDYKDLQEYARRIVIRHECKTVPITAIEARDAKVGIKPNEVPLAICISAVEGQMDSSLMIQGILDHLVAANRAILQFCKQYEDEDLYASATDFIDLTHISRSSDVVDIAESELLSILQDCIQQSLEYGKQTSFAMNLALLESKLYERYIIGRKLINYSKQQLAFVFAGYHDIKSYVDKINTKFSFSKSKKHKANVDNTYFEQCSAQLLDSVSLKLRIKLDKIETEYHDDDEYELRIINSAKKGIEQTLIALLRWPTLPNKNGSIAKFMKENLKLYKEEYELFESMADCLLLKHCDGLWRLLDRLYILKQGKWSQIPTNIAAIFCKKITNEALIIELKQFVNAQDTEEMLQLLIDWKQFMEDILSDQLLNVNQTSLITYLNYTVTNPDILKDAFPKDIKLTNCVSAYDIAATQFKSKTIQK